MQNPNLIIRPVDPTRRRYYLVNRDVHRSTTDMEPLNESELLGPESPSTMHNVSVFAGKDSEGKDQFYCGSYGLPKFYAKPQIKVGLRNKLLDFYRCYGREYVSPRAKAMLENIDPEGFVFRECDTVTRNKVQLEPYWMMAVRRVVLEYDEERSVIRERGGRNPKPLPPGVSMGISTIYDMRMCDDMPDECHAFYQIKYSSHYIFDEVIVDAWRKNRFSGLNFSPLQPPNKAELRNVDYYHNRSYFLENRRKDWEDLVCGDTCCNP